MERDDRMTGCGFEQFLGGAHGALAFAATNRHHRIARDSDATLVENGNLCSH